MFRQVNKSLWSKMAMQRNAGNESKHTYSMFPSNLDGISTVAAAPSSAVLKTRINTGKSKFTSIKINVTTEVAKIHDHQKGSNGSGMKLINIDLQKTPKLLSKFSKCNVFTENVIFSLSQVSDTLQSFLLESGSGGDISCVAEVFYLLGEIKEALSTEMASGVIMRIINETHINICGEILNKYSVNTDDELFELYYCIGYLLILKTNLNEKFINNIMDTIDKKIRNASKKRQKNYGNLSDSSLNCRMLDHGIDLIRHLLKWLGDDCMNEYYLLVIGKLFNSMSNAISNMWCKLECNLIESYLDLLVQWLDKIKQIYMDLVCKSKKVLLVRQGAYADLYQNNVKNTNGINNYSDLKKDGWSGHYAHSLNCKTGESEDKEISCQLQTIEQYCMMILTQCIKIGSIGGRDKIYTYNESNENEVLCPVKFIVNVLNRTLGDVGELIDDECYLKSINHLLENLVDVLKHGIPVNDCPVELRDTEIELIVGYVSECATNVLEQMADISSTGSIARNIYKQLNCLVNYLESLQFFVKKDIHSVLNKIKSVLNRYHEKVVVQILAASKPPRARGFAATALIFGSSGDDSSDNVTNITHNNTIPYKLLSFGDPKKSNVKSGMGLNQFVEIKFKNIVQLSSIQASVLFKNRHDYNSNKCNRLEYYDKQANEFLTLEKFDMSESKCCYPKNNHVWLHNTSITTNRLRFITDNGSVTLSFLKID